MTYAMLASSSSSSRQRRSSTGSGPALSTSMWALTISIAALVVTLLNTTMRPCSTSLRLTAGGPQTAALLAAGDGAAGSGSASDRPLLGGAGASSAGGVGGRSSGSGAGLLLPQQQQQQQLPYQQQQPGGSGQLDSLVAAAAAAATAGGRPQQQQQHRHLIRDPLPDTALAATAPPQRTLSFQVCNGFANQRLALIYGLLAAKQLGRAAVLPTLILDGTQLTEAARVAGDAGGGGTSAFEDFYDSDALRDAVAPHGVRLLTQREFDALGGTGSGSSSVSVSLAAARPISDVPRHFAAQRGAAHVSLDCPLFKLSPSVVLAEQRFVWAVLRALKPAPALEGHVARALARVPEGRPFNFLHIRLERDWQAHCARWAALSAADGVVRDNCWNGTLDVHRAMAGMGFDRGVPVYVTAHWAGADPSVSEEVLGGIRRAGYEVVKAEESGGGAPGLPRELGALVEYEVAMRAERFLGNSVSTFSALAILQRRQAGKWAGYYNGGDIPLVQVLPLFSTPWVFTFNSWSAGYEPMLKAAVNSALKQGGIAPHCVFAGDPRAPIAAWMASKGVKVLHHEPAWRARLVELTRGHDNTQRSHLFASEQSVVGTWQRIDLPLVPWLDQYTYVLFTDTDVLFRRPFSFQEFPRPLPRAVGMGPEMVDMFPYNAGIMLANLPRLRETYPAFLDFILANKHGLDFPGFGPGDQGAYNQFYEADVRAWRLPSKFNAKPYHAADPPRVSDVAIVHFHGPKPSDYLAYANTGQCPKFGDMCRSGVAARACMFVHEWVRRLEGGDAEEAHAAWRSGCAKA